MECECIPVYVLFLAIVATHVISTEFAHWYLKPKRTLKEQTVPKKKPVWVPTANHILTPL